MLIESVAAEAFRPSRTCMLSLVSCQLTLSSGKVVAVQVGDLNWNREKNILLPAIEVPVKQGGFPQAESMLRVGFLAGWRVPETLVGTLFPFRNANISSRSYDQSDGTVDVSLQARCLTTALQ
jgi:hypothetical protein